MTTLMAASKTAFTFCTLQRKQGSSINLTLRGSNYCDNQSMTISMFTVGDSSESGTHHHIYLISIDAISLLRAKS